MTKYNNMIGIDSFYHLATETFFINAINMIYSCGNEESARKR